MRSNTHRLLIASATAAATVAALAAATPAQAQPAATTSPQTATVTPGLTSGKVADKHVIVLLKNQHTGLAPKLGGGRASQRASVIAGDQSGVVDAARNLGATHVSQFNVINAFAATISSAKLAQLSRNSDVAAIVPDLPISKPAAVDTDGGTRAPQDTANPTPTTLPYSSYCSTDKTKPMLEPEALQTMHVAYNNAATPSAAKLGADGAGVKVAYIADGIDINNPDFIRADGSHVFTDYQDFSGEGANAPSSAAEAFGDASSIAAQGRQTYDLNDFASPANPLTAGCYIRVQGVAPGASLVGLKVFGNAESAPTSHFISAIQYAVNVDGVNVLNESFGGNPYPDNRNDPISLANNAAIAAGVTVVASEGDAGPNGTEGTPATSDQVIGVAATTNFRSAAQIKYDGFSNEALGIKGWANDNISSLSSGGFAQNGKVPDVSAPGDSAWALCTPNTDIYIDCVGANGEPSSVLDFGGTSQSSPLTAGTAALVIQAYKQAHNGQLPSPQRVKAIIVGTAQDLGHPAYEQGSGEVDALAAVQAARSVPASGSSTVPSTATGANLITTTSPYGTDQLNLAGQAGSTVSGSYFVRNASKSTQTVSLSTRAITKTVSSATGSVTLDPNQTFPNVTGGKRAYKIIDVKVPVGADRLDASFTANTGNYTVFMALVDPLGVYQAYSSPQGIANFGHIDARYPAPGTWKAMVWANPAFTGPINYKFTTSKFGSFGTVSPSTLTLKPGALATVKASFPTNSNAGDTSAAVVMKSSLGDTSTEAVSVRTLIPTKAASNTFTGVLTGGNGRSGEPAQTNQYYLDVPKGKPGMSVGIKLDSAATPGELFTAYLIAPDGMPQSVRTSVVVGKDGLELSRTAYTFVRTPAAGRWKFVLNLSQPVSGQTIDKPFTGLLRFGTPPISAASKLPTAGTVLTKGKTYKYTINIHNSSAQQQAYFADPRLNKQVTYQLASQTPGNDLQNLPLPETGVTPEFLVPASSTAVDFYANATVPIGLDTFYFSGEPETFSAGNGNAAHVNVTGSPLANGLWSEDIGEPGPFDGAAPSGSVAANATATTAQFDAAADSSLGDYWLTSLIPAPATTSSTSSASHGAQLGKASPYLADMAKQARTTPVASPKVAACDPQSPFIEAGQTCSITFEITPTAAKGTTVSGQLHIGTVDLYNGNGNDLAALPYAYKVG